MEEMHRAKAPMLSLSMLKKCFLKEGRCEKTPSTGQFERVDFSLSHFCMNSKMCDIPYEFILNTRHLDICILFPLQIQSLDDFPV